VLKEAEAGAKKADVHQKQGQGV